MAELHRQLQDYLTQAKGAPVATVPLLTEEETEEPAAGNGVMGARLSLTSLRWTRARNSKEPAAGDPTCLPTMTRKQRLAASAVCLSLAALCFGLAALYAPVLLLRARKFALLWSLGSALALAGGALLRGGAACEGLLRCREPPSRPALLYAAALGATLYAALGLRSAALTVLGACAQMAALLGLLFSLLPWGGGAALRLALGRMSPGTGFAQVLPV